jgi:hypothetical protein
VQVSPHTVLTPTRQPVHPGVQHCNQKTHHHDLCTCTHACRLCRFSLYFFGKAFTAMCGCCCKESHTSTLYEEVTYEAALLARHAQSDNSGAGHSAFADVTVALAGAPTYRLPHHPRYSETFHNPLYKPVWFKAFGRLRYTTLVSDGCPACWPACCPALSCSALHAVMHCPALTALLGPDLSLPPCPLEAHVTLVLYSCQHALACTIVFFLSHTAAVPPWWRLHHCP